MGLDATHDQPVVRTDRFDLRPVRRSDIGLMELYTGDERVARMTTSIPQPPPKGTKTSGRWMPPRWAGQS